MYPANLRTIVLAMVLLAVVCAVPALAAPAPAGPDVTADIKYLPSDTSLLFVIRIEQLLASDGYKKLRQDVPDIDKNFEGSFRKEFGFELRNITLMTYGGNLKGRPVGVFHLKEAVKPDTVVNAMSGPRYDGDKGTVYKQEKIGALTLYVPDQEYRQSFCFLNDKTLVVGQLKELKPALGREAKPETSAGLQAALKMIDPTATVSMAMDTKAVLGAEKASIPGVDLNKVIDGASGAALNIKIGTDLMLRGVTVCKDAAAAEDVKTQAEAFRTFVTGLMQGAPKGQIPKEALEIPGKIEFSTKGNLGIATLAMKAEGAILLMKFMVVSKKASAAPDVQAPPVPKSIERKP